jgi:hypothetical protein
MWKALFWAGKAGFAEFFAEHSNNQTTYIFIII